MTTVDIDVLSEMLPNIKWEKAPNASLASSDKESESNANGGNSDQAESGEKAAEKEGSLATFTADNNDHLCVLKLDQASNRRAHVGNVQQPSSSTEDELFLNTGDRVHLPVELPKNNKGRIKKKYCQNCINKLYACKTTFYCPMCYKSPGLCLTCFREYHSY